MSMERFSYAAAAVAAQRAGQRLRAALHPAVSPVSFAPYVLFSKVLSKAKIELRGGEGEEPLVAVKHVQSHS